MAEKVVPYPDLLDGFGKELVVAIQQMKSVSLKPAIMADIIKVYDAVLWTQQLLAMFYNLHVKNHAILMEKIVAVEKKNEELATKLAGYSERLNGFETEFKKYKSEEAERLVKLISENSIVREVIRSKT